MNHWRRYVIATFAALLVIAPAANAETLSENLQSVFDQVLNLELSGSPGAHGQHFRPSNVQSSQLVIDALTSYISINASAFPLTSTSAGVTFDFSSGAPQAVLSSAGPIFSGRAETLGKKRLSVGGNLSFLSMNKFRGVDVSDMRLTFLHQDVPPDTGLGDRLSEQDYIDLFLNMDLSATVLATYATYGVSDHFDIGIAIPFVSVSMKSDPVAVMNSSSYEVSGSALHFWGGTAADPLLELHPTAIDETATGLGDIALRAKYNFMSDRDIDMAVMTELRLATGDADNFLGAGDPSYKFVLMASSELSGFAPHVNLGYDVRTSDLDRNDWEISFGYDFQPVETVTLIADWIAEIEVGDEIDELQFPEPTVIHPVNPTTGDPIVPISRTISSTNVPNTGNDNISNASFGVKYHPSEKFLLIANFLLPTNDNGLRSEFVPTIGFEYSF